MNYKELFFKKNILKMSLISLSIIMWMFFYKSSNISLNALISLNLTKIINSFLTLDFLFLLLFFPITSAICIALSVKKSKQTDLMEIFIGITLGFLLSFIFFKPSLNFIIFSLFYLGSHLILSILTYKKFKERDKINHLANFATSKISLLLTLSLFIVVFLVLLPNQAIYSQKMQIGMVNLFVGEEISDWIGTSYSISKASTVSVVDFITETNQYKGLNTVQDTRVYDFIDFIEDLKRDVSEKTTREDLERVYANLNTTEVKNSVLQTITNLPLMIVFNQFFALFYALLISSAAQIYFAIGFSLIGFFYVFLFFKVFHKNIKNKDKSKKN